VRAKRARIRTSFPIGIRSQCATPWVTLAYTSTLELLSGQNVLGNDDEEDLINNTPIDNNNNNNNRTRRMVPTCKSCGKKGHATSRSKKCPNNSGATVPAAAQPVALFAATNNSLTDDDDLAECQLYDAVPLVDDPTQLDTEEDLEALQAFLLAGGREDDNDDVGIVRAPI
jgi:hypothetical protein